MASRYTPRTPHADEPSTIKVDDNYVEFRHFDFIYDLLKAPGLANYPPIGWAINLQYNTPAKLQKLIEWADIILNEEVYQTPVLAKMTDSTPIVYSSHNVEAESHEWVQKKPFGKYFHRHVAERERHSVATASAVICASERDRQEFERRYGTHSTPMIVAPNSISQAAIRDSSETTARERSLREKHDIDEDQLVGLFVGTDYGPNITAANETVEIAKAVQERDVSVHFFIVGSVGMRVPEVPENVTVTGFVDDLEAYYDLTDFALNPMREGGGTNIKILDYFARELPVITTRFGARGLDIQEDEGMIVAENVDDFAEAIAQSIQTEIGERARQYVEQNHTWQVVSRNLRHELAALQS